MRVVIAVGDFGPDVGAVEAAQQLARGWQVAAPHDEVVSAGLSDGGPGFVATVAQSIEASPTPAMVTGPTGAQVPAALLLVPEEGGRTAYLQADLAVGRDLVDSAQLADPADLSSAGVGDLLELALQAGARRVVLGCGDLAVHDGGLGMLRALGAGANLEDLPRVRERFADVDLVLAAASELPLLGFHGASAALGSEHGVSAEVTQRLENRMGELTELVAATLPSRRDLLTGQPIRLERAPGSGVGGGVGYAMLLLGARTVPAARLVLERSGLVPLLPGALVVTGVDTYDWRGIRDGVIAEVATAASAAASPSVVLARQIHVGRREGMSLGIAGTYALGDGEDLPALAARVARTWSPPPATEAGPPEAGA